MIKAFLVEDQADIRQTLIEGMEETVPLQFIGHASDETDAVAWLGHHEGEWDLAIVDLFLREGSGFGVLKRCQRRSPRQKVVVFSSYTDERVLQRCRDMGADAVFDKSLEVEKLVEFCLNHEEDLNHMSPAGLITESQPAPLDTGTMALQPLAQHRARQEADVFQRTTRPPAHLATATAPVTPAAQRHNHFFAARPPADSRDGEPDHLAARNAALSIAPQQAAGTGTAGSAPATSGIAGAPAATRWFTRDAAVPQRKQR